MNENLFQARATKHLYLSLMSEFNGLVYVFVDIQGMVGRYLACTVLGV